MRYIGIGLFLLLSLNTFAQDKRVLIEAIGAYDLLTPIDLRITQSFIEARSIDDHQPLQLGIRAHFPIYKELSVVFAVNSMIWKNTANIGVSLPLWLNESTYLGFTMSAVGGHQFIYDNSIVMDDWFAGTEFGASINHKITETLQFSYGIDLGAVLYDEGSVGLKSAVFFSSGFRL